MDELQGVMETISERCPGLALAALKALGAESRDQMREQALGVIGTALQETDWSESERARLLLVMRRLRVRREDGRNVMVYARVSPMEREWVQEQADRHTGGNLSSFVRMRLGL